MTITDDIDVHQTQRACPCGDAWGAPVWCPTCFEDITHDLNRLPHLTAGVAIRKDGHLVAGRALDSEVRAKRVHPGSLSPAWDAIDEIIRWARTWCERLADQLQRRHQHLGSHNSAGLPMEDLRGDVDYLARFLTPLLVGPWAESFGTEVRSQAARVERLAGVEMARHPLPVYCPSCERMSLSRLDGSDRVECGAPGCHLVMTYAEYEALVRRLAAGGGW